ncbi:lipoprotein [Ramlibacter sp. USB13]|uniref:Lipoprotein n=1 Tax=Ramlibacter cellulosilyticus TaxID=2764187 RepID=A0A923SC45_9BURK|nr:lipoprotein [Ramlibacter cellulosilyticus]MBC5784555.1 lipoprotein [Ramlibacter cellulosilyticus]
MLLPILVSARGRRVLAAGVLALLAACGQKGPLFLPTGDAAAGRATLPETLSPTNRTGSGTAIVPSTAASSLPPTGIVNPVRN